MCRTLQGHGHWVNHLALNTDYALRMGAFNPAEQFKTPNGSGTVYSEQVCCPNVCWELICNGLVSHPGGVKDCHPLNTAETRAL